MQVRTGQAIENRDNKEQLLTLWDPVTTRNFPSMDQVRGARLCSERHGRLQGIRSRGIGRTCACKALTVYALWYRRLLCTRLYAGVLRSKKRDLGPAVCRLRLLEIICEIVIKHWGRINSKLGEREDKKKRKFAWEKSGWTGAVYVQILLLMPCSLLSW